MQKHPVVLTAALAILLPLCSVRCTSAQSAMQSPQVQLPDKPDAVRFAVIGDNGTGEEPEYQIGEQMERAHTAFPFTFVVMLGDNIYGKKTPEDFKRKFEDPYNTLLDEGVRFYASLGNHDDPNERYYQPFNMGGQRYYSFQKGNVEFFALDSTYMDPAQLDWIKKELANSNVPWKICFFHHPLYSAAHYHGPDLDLRKRLEPIFKQYGVNVVLNGHEHVYERVKPEGGIDYFVLGSAGQLRVHDLRESDETAKGFDTDRAFMLMEVAGDQLYFQVISRSGATVDSGTIKRQQDQAK